MPLTTNVTVDNEFNYHSQIWIISFSFLKQMTNCEPFRNPTTPYKH